MRTPEGWEIQRTPEKDTPGTAAFEVTLYPDVHVWEDPERRTLAGQTESLREAVREFGRDLGTEIFGSPSRSLYAAAVNAVRCWSDGITRGLGGGVPHRLGVVEVECVEGLHDPEAVMGSFVAAGEACPACGAVL